MKKKIFLISIMAMLFACLFAFSVSAADNIIKLDKLPTLEEIHENREAYVSRIDALEVFEEGKTNYKELDPDSVVVLSDLAETPTYYVYPCYYFIKSSAYNIAGNISNFNKAIQEADSTAFAGYTSAGGNWGNGECDYVIRIEVPKYVTQVLARYKFEGSANVKEIYFPIHTVIDEETGEEKTVAYCTTISGENLFSTCKALEIIHNTQYLPIGLVQGNNAGFSSCNSLKEFHIPEGVTHIPNYFFDYCNSLTELAMPNSLKSVGKQAFAHCANLETVRFGASFTTFYSVNNDFETFSGTNNYKYIYMPASTSVFSVNGNEATTAKNIFSSGKNVTFFFTGTQEQAVALQEKFIKSGSNGVIEKATIVEYDPNIDYVGYAESLGYSIIVYGYNTCKAFYGDNHEGSTSYGFDGDEYASEYCRFDGCQRCGDLITTSYGYLFVNKGYSTESNGSGFTFGIAFNKEAIAKYEEIEQTTFKYGFVAGKITEGDGGNVVNQNGEKATDNVFTSLFTNTEYELFTVKVTGIDNAEYKAKDIYCSAFIIDGENVYYVGDNVTSTAVAVSYDKIFAGENTTNEE